MKVFEIEISHDPYIITDPWGDEIKIHVDLLHYCRHLTHSGETVDFLEPWGQKWEKRDVMVDGLGRRYRHDPPMDIGACSMFKPLDWEAPAKHLFYARPSSKLVWAHSREPVTIIPD